MLESVSVSVFTVGVCFVVFVVCCTAVSPIIPEMEGNQCIYWHAFFFMYNFGLVNVLYLVLLGCV